MWVGRDKGQEFKVTAKPYKGWSRKALILGVLALSGAQADAQSVTPTALAPAPSLQTYVTAPGPLSTTDMSRLKQAIDYAQAGNRTSAAELQATIADPVARKLIQWAVLDASGPAAGFFAADSGRRELWGWPRASRRHLAAERSLEAAGLAPQRVVEWFEDKKPQTAEGALALASAYQQLGRQQEAAELIRKYWREEVFEAAPQAAMLARYGILLTPEDHAKRLDLLLYGPQGPAAQAMLPLVSGDVRALATARIALRGNKDNAAALANSVPGQFQKDPGLAYERARYFRKRGLDSIAAGYLKDFADPPKGYEDAASSMWTERRALMTALIRSGDLRSAYAAVTNHGLPEGVDYTEAEFFAGWLLLSKLDKPAEAAEHFANIRKAGTSPQTVSRALYWQGRAAEAVGDRAGAHRYWTEGAKYYTAFYGQLSAERAGVRQITLPSDPDPTAADRARFEGRELVRAARMLADAGERPLFRTFVLAVQDTLPTVEELGLLVDMARLYGDQDLAMRVVRAGATRGLYLTERGYPVRTVPQGYGLPEPALIHSIIRQESGFDPSVRSGVGAQGMMQLMPGTAQVVARKLGVGYSQAQLGNPEYNMRLGSAYLGELVDQFSGSYVMAAAGYNAGPGRSTKWAAECGDPRAGATDPADFIECIPFAETRNYVMRILEAAQIYRARLSGGTAPLTLASDLKRGGWQPSMAAQDVKPPATANCAVASLAPGATIDLNTPPQTQTC